MNAGSKKAFIKRSSEVLSILLLFAGVILSRLYLFDIYKVPSYSMEPTLLAGDFILVSKAEYGPRVINISRLLFKRELVYRWHRREKKPQLNDLIVFNQPKYGSASSEFSSSLGPVMVKRITGLPGDSVRIFRTGMDRAYNNVFPFDTSLHWAVDHYGPLYVPRKGDTLELSEINRLHYATVITFECGLAGDKGIQGGILKQNETIHCFRFNYYFVTGDNFYMSADSRHWGFVPETHIIGKATRILFSIDRAATWNKKFRWNRFLKKLE
jgi:signal peptidase I